MNYIRNILITDVGHPVTASAIETLRGVASCTYNIIGIDHSVANYPVGRLWVDQHYVVPSPEDIEGYTRAVLDICIQHKVDVIVPWTNEEAIIFAEHASIFSDHNIKILTSDVSGINKVVDKYFLMNNLKEFGFATPLYHSVDTLQELVSAVKILGYPAKKVVVKPRNLSGARGFCLLDQDSDISERGFSSLPFSAYLEIIKHLPHAKQNNLDLIAMEYLSGEDYSVDVLARESKSIAIIPRLRLQATGGVSSMGETIEAPKVSRIASNVVEAFGLNLNVNVQMRYRRGRQGEPFVYDVNPRISGTIAANDHVGINFIHEGIQVLLGESPSLSKKSTYTHAIMIRRWKEEYIDLKGNFEATVR